LGTQTPPLHVLPASQVTAGWSGTSPVTLQTDEPVEHSVVPTLHGWPDGVHTVPWVHEHVPLAHPRFVPQLVPLVALLPVSVHTGTPVAQDWVPLWQIAVVGVHDVPSVQATHAPPRHTWPVPQLAVPSFTLPAGVHTDVPVEQSVVPVWQGLLGVQTSPVLQATQLPPLQTKSVPQDVPLPRFTPRSVHTGVPAEQSRLPVWQGAVVGAHGDPPAQLTQAPLLHTCLLPQPEPSAAFPLCTQTDVPDAHEVLPTLHVVPTGVQS
jgi:hypothetical protein